MTTHLLEAMSREGFEEVHALQDSRSGMRAFLALHNTRRGPAFGGIRRSAYRDEEEALLDCLRLAKAMSYKCALADLPAGGAKLVLLESEDVFWPEAYRAVGRAVERLAGRYYTGPDMGTGPEELSEVASETRYATDPGPDGPGELAEATAMGVFRGIEAALVHLDGEPDWSARTVHVQGLGAVGRLLAKTLSEHGSKVLASETHPERATAVAGELDLELVAPEWGLRVPCDVFAPCAIGGILHDVTISRLATRVVAGGANNVLARTEVGDGLHARGILYVPDIVLNAGALIRGALFHLEGRREPVEAIGRRVAASVTSVLQSAQGGAEPPARVAARLAEERLAGTR